MKLQGARLLALVGGQLEGAAEVSAGEVDAEAEDEGVVLEVVIVGDELGEEIGAGIEVEAEVEEAPEVEGAEEGLMGG